LNCSSVMPGFRLKKVVTRYIVCSDIWVVERKTQKR
jgi:hypothetical protein